MVLVYNGNGFKTRLNEYLPIDFQFIECRISVQWYVKRTGSTGIADVTTVIH